MRVSVKRTEERPELQIAARTPLAQDPTPSCRCSLQPPPARSASSRPWSASSTARRSRASPSFVEVGDVVVPGQTLCLLEAMKLFNELKADAEGRVTGDPCRERQAGRVRAAPLRARADRRTRRLSDVRPRPRREPGRDRRPGDPRRARARRRGRRGLFDRRRRRAPRPARRPRGLHRAAVGVGELPPDPERDRRGRDDRLRGGPSRATASSPRTRPSSAPARTTTSSSSARART